MRFLALTAALCLCLCWTLLVFAERPITVFWEAPAIIEKTLSEARPQFGANDTWVILVLAADDPAADLHRDTFTSVIAMRDEELPPEHRYALLEETHDTAPLFRKWLLLRSPSLVFVANHGEDIYHFNAADLTNSQDRLWQMLHSNTWRTFAKPWTGFLAPGGFVYPVLLYAIPVFKLYNQAPSWLVLAVSLVVGHYLKKSLDRDRAIAAGTTEGHAHSE